MENILSNSSISLKQICTSALEQDEFDSAAAFYLVRANQQLGLLPGEKSIENLNESELVCLKNFHSHRKLARAYLAYHPLYEYVTFRKELTRHDELHLFKRAIYLFNELESLKTTSRIDKTKVLPLNFSAPVLFWSLAQLSVAVGAFQLAKLAYSKLLDSHYPPKWTRALKQGALLAQAYTQRDAADLLITCPLCQTRNPLYSSSGNHCVQCKQPFVFCMACFEALPLVELHFPDSMSESEAEKALLLDPQFAGELAKKNTSLKISHPNLSTPVRVESLLISDKHLANLTLQILQTIPKHLVFKCDYGKKAVASKYYKVAVFNQQLNDYEADEDIKCRLVLCSVCLHFFHQDEFICLSMEERKCPFCKMDARTTDVKFQAIY